jgi:hypothetical protein
MAEIDIVDALFADGFPAKARPQAAELRGDVTMPSWVALRRRDIA